MAVQPRGLIKPEPIEPGPELVWLTSERTVYAEIGELLSAPQALSHPTKFTPNEGAHLDHIAAFDFVVHNDPAVAKFLYRHCVVLIERVSPHVIRPKECVFNPYESVPPRPASS